MSSTLQKQLRRTSRRSHTGVCCPEGFIRESDPGTGQDQSKNPEVWEVDPKVQSHLSLFSALGDAVFGLKN